jgi:hypothetical protein
MDVSGACELALLDAQRIYGKRVRVLRYLGVDYFIGVDLAGALDRETFNVYRSLKMKKIPVVRLDLPAVDVLVRSNILTRGTRSATLLPVNEVVPWLELEILKRRGAATTTTTTTPQEFQTEQPIGETPDEESLASDTGYSRSTEEYEYDACPYSPVHSDAEDGTPAWMILASFKMAGCVPQ